MFRTTLVLTTVMLTAGLALALHVNGAGASDLQRGWGTPVQPGTSVQARPAWLYVVGIDRYEHVPKLTTAVHDAQAVRDLLQAKFQFDDEHLLERYDGDATRENIVEDLHWLAENLGEDDDLLIYYAGHGVEDEAMSDGHWVPVDGRRDKVSSLVSNSYIRAALKGIPARHIWLVSDSCFSGSLFGDRNVGEVISERYYTEKYKLRSRQVFTSGGDEPVADGGEDGHSVFAYHFLHQLQHAEAAYLVPSEVTDEVSRVVGNDSQQTPQFAPLREAGDAGGEFVLINRHAAPQAGEEDGSALPGERTPAGGQTESFASPAVPPDGRPIPPPSGGAGPLEPPEGSLLRQHGYAMVVLQVGAFQMGSPPDEPGRSDDEQQHEVVLTRSLAIGTTEVTQKLWQAVMGDNPSRHREPLGPVEQISWLDAVAFCNALSALDGLTPAYQVEGEAVRWDRDADGYRLPSEAEWEYAARGGGQGVFAGGDAPDDVAWYQANASSRPAEVGILSPNEWGLYDMSGNLWEWVFDGKRSYTTTRRQDPVGSTSDRYRVLRGGCWAVGENSLRVANRHWEVPAHRSDKVGFRIARSP